MSGRVLITVTGTPEPWIASCAMLWLAAVATIGETFGRRLRVVARGLTLKFGCERIK